MPITHLPADIRSDMAGDAALTRLAYMTPEQQRDMTAAARAAREANYLERLKDEVDPERQYSDEERTRRAEYLREARRRKARARAERQRRLEAIDNEFAEVAAS